MTGPSPLSVLGYRPNTMTRKFPSLYEIAKSATVGASRRGILNKEQCDLQNELCARAGQSGVSLNGIILPFYEKRDLTTTAAQGGHSIETDVPEIGTALRAGLVLEAMGARVFGGLRANVKFPSMPVAITAAWASENGTAGDVTQTFANLSLVPLRVTGHFDVSVMLLDQAPETIEPYLRSELMAAVGAEIQRVAIAGTGASNEPLGIINTVGIGSVAGGANGLAPTNAHLADLENAVCGTAKADRGKTAWITSPYVRRKLRSTFINGTGSEPVWSRDSAYSLFGHPAAVTPSSPDTLTKGTSSGVCSAIVFGEMSELIIGFWGDGISVEATSSKALATAGKINLSATCYVNCGVRSPAAFAAMLDALAA